MTGLLYLLTIYGVLRCARSTRPRRWAALAIGACAVGMLTKPVIATAPIVAILFDWTIVTGRWRDVWRHRWALHAGLLATVPLLVLTGTVGKVLATESEHLRTAGLAFDGCTPWQYLLTQSGVILHYLRLTIWPAPLCLDYAWPFAASFGAVAVPFTVVTLLFAACVAALWLRPAAGFLGVAFFVILAPTSSVLPIADAAVEHRMYLPLACVVVGIVLATRRLLANLPEPRRLAVGGVATGLVAVVLTACTLQRNRDYHDAMAMWQTVIECRPENPRAYNELGNLLAARDDMATATGCYEVAAKLMPTEPLFVSNAANACLQLDRVDDAIRYGQLALRAREDYQPAHNILGSAFVARGSVDEGIRHLREAVRLDPDDPWARCNLGRVLALASGVSRSGGPVDETLLEAGVVELNETLRRHPGFPDAVNVLTHIRRLRERGPQRAAAASE
jgi:hypothetical protein